MKYRILQPFLLLGMTLSVILYCFAMIIIWPIFFIGAIVWKIKIVHRMLDFYFNSVPEIPEPIKPNKPI